MIRGVTKNVAINGPVSKNTDESEIFVPNQIDRRNGRLSDGNSWVTRPGFITNWNLGIDENIKLLIPKDTGYAGLKNGRIFQLGNTITEMTGQKLNGNYRPNWIQNDAKIVIVDGGSPIKIFNSITSLLGGSPSNFRFIGMVGPYTIGCGHSDTEFKWCASNNVENWTTGDSGFANVKKDGILQGMKIIKERVYFFKNNSTEIWYNRGGTTPFVRIDYIERGLKPSDSIIQDGSILCFIGDDLRFYKMEGINPIVISSPYEKYIQSMVNHDQTVGYHFAKEHLYVWVFPIDGRVLIYDYKFNTWSEDNTWTSGQWGRIPINSYMELNNKQYIGSYNEDGLIYEWSKDNKTDNGDPIRNYRRFAVKPSENGHRNRFNRLQFRLKRGVADATTPNPVFTWRYRFDRGDWGNENPVDMGVVGDYNPYVTRSNLGIGREIEFETSCTDAVEHLMTEMNLTVRELEG